MRPCLGLGVRGPGGDRPRGEMQRRRPCLGFGFGVRGPGGDRPRGEMQRRWGLIRAAVAPRYGFGAWRPGGDRSGGPEM